MIKNSIPGRLLFFQSDNLTTIISRDENCAFFRSTNTPLALISACNSKKANLLAMDYKDSIIAKQNYQSLKQYNYTPYGYDNEIHHAHSLLGFNGELHQQEINGYLLGNGYRTYSPTTMRLNKPDSLSPLGSGGINSYAFIANDPINGSDPSGHNKFPSFPRLRYKYRTFKGQHQIIDGIIVFMAKHPTKTGEQAITMVSHGANGKFYPNFSSNPVDTEQFLNRVAAKFDTGKYDTHAITCNTLNTTSTGDSSLSQTIANHTGRDSYGYYDTVRSKETYKIRKSDNQSEIHSRLLENVPFWQKNNPFFNFKRGHASPRR